MQALLHPSYFPSISNYVAMVQADSVLFEIEDNFQKQTNRNRAYIYSPNGLQLLNIPIKHSKNQNQKTKDIIVDSSSDWQKQHYKSLETAYRSSPFFEFFEDDIRPFYEKEHKYLLDLNYESIAIVSKCLRKKITFETTTEYFREVDPIITKDFRYLIDGKKDDSVVQRYMQVFEDKHGFLNNLSILDLLFNEGKFTIDYLREQQLFIK